MEQTTGVAVLATHLAQTDRRALSQAWYDALHLAHASPAHRAAPPGRVFSAAPLACATDGRASTPPHARAATAGVEGPRTRGAPREPEPPALERRMPKTELARRIERVLTRRAPRAVPASFAVSTGGARVRILVRSEGERTRVLAVCAPPLRERVEHALAQARFALAARGVRTEVV
jgi:hypothetical protein